MNKSATLYARKDYANFCILLSGYSLDDINKISFKEIYSFTLSRNSKYAIIRFTNWSRFSNNPSDYDKAMIVWKNIKKTLVDLGYRINE